MATKTEQTHKNEWRINGAGGQHLIELRRQVIQARQMLQVALEQSRAMVDAPPGVSVVWEADAVLLRVPQNGNSPAE